jgi:hypothetical protein
MRAKVKFRILLACLVQAGQAAVQVVNHGDHNVAMLKILKNELKFTSFIDMCPVVPQVARVQY